MGVIVRNDVVGEVFFVDDKENIEGRQARDRAQE